MKEPEFTLKVSAIFEYVCEAKSVIKADLLADKRHQGLVRARHLCMWLIFHGTDFSLTETGRELRKDHTTVLHGISKVDGDEDLLAEAKTVATVLQTRSTTRGRVA